MMTPSSTPKLFEGDFTSHPQKLVLCFAPNDISKTFEDEEG
jgi:hypothetical protein